MSIHEPHALRKFAKRLAVDDDERAARLSVIADNLLADSPTIREPNFTRISGADVERLFHGYDQKFFGGLLVKTLHDIPIEFRVSSRMTSAGGKTGSWRLKKRSAITKLEIAVSSTLLLRTFTGDEISRPITVTGLECSNRLQALMRVMEHELVHLTELLGWDVSSCKQDRFHSIAWRTFGHTDHRHALVTPREQAASQGIRPGIQVQFTFEGRRLQGLVNRVTRRATVLVPDPSGHRFSDGMHYQKYYIPLSLLTLVDAPSSPSSDS